MNELSKPIKILQLKNTLEFYLDEEESGHVAQLLESVDVPQFIKYKGRFIRTSEIVGLFDPVDLESQQRRRSGQWKDKQGRWHDRGERVCPNCDNVVPEGKYCGRCVV